ncbi:Hypothetical protein R9X50_00292400 [Acrodontium crateriforme]|uniref:Biogenesis of lysosome-related organelles complex 1 subunit KXD1 n=1 Tax=Acrodontium crateriforme TaxID=150365 RepID=A0AAQ3M596_9PEZI|nr:Hypothetical protein R9X50_00292400 [Acrodontium crateriforme]
MSTYYNQYQPTRAVPVKGHGKQPQYVVASRPAYPQISRSPPEVPESISSGELYSSVSSNSSVSDGDSPPSGAVYEDLPAYMNHRLPTVYDPTNLDRTLVTQAQDSAELRMKQREIQEMQARVRARMARLRPNVAEGMRQAKEVQQDLEWTQRKMAAMNVRAAAKYPAQYRAANKRYPREHIDRSSSEDDESD